MGTCFSHPTRESTNPYSEGNGNNHDASSRPINSSQPQIQQRPQTARSTQQAPALAPASAPVAPSDLTKSPNQPLKLPEPWTSNDRTWTREQLDTERRIFFETQSGNQRVVWDSIKSACEVLWAGGDAGDTDGGLATAQTILDAAEYTLPTGSLHKGYDSKGAKYVLPEYIISDPTNIVAPSPLPSPSIPACAPINQGPPTPLTEEQAEIRRENKGKGVEDPLLIVVKRSDLGDKRHAVNINKTDTCRLIAIKVEEQTRPSLDAKYMVVLFYRGKRMDGSKTLADNDWFEGNLEAKPPRAADVLNAMVLERDRSEWGSDARLP